MHPLVNTGVQAARSASRIITQGYDRLDRVTVNEKAQNDYVSSIDKAVQDHLIEQIRERYPNHAIIAEEGHRSEGDEYTWIIDPLDGTANFIHGLPHFAISMAIKEGNKLIAGVIYDPLRDELFTAVKGKGAQINSQRIRISSQKTLEGAMLATGFPYKNRESFDSYLKTFSHLFNQAHDIRRMGSASLDLAYVACGRFDGFWESHLKIWDIAAGVLMVREAGGMVTDLAGGESYLESGNLVAGNTRMVKTLLENIKQSA
jgi:myo-inositol-1(or 4)-monophosphatase